MEGKDKKKKSISKISKEDKGDGTIEEYEEEYEPTLEFLIRVGYRVIQFPYEDCENETELCEDSETSIQQSDVVERGQETKASRKETST